MRIAVTHTSHYQFENPACHGLQRLRLRPRDCAVQRVLDWSMRVEGGVIEAEYADHNGNTVDLLKNKTRTGEYFFSFIGRGRATIRQLGPAGALRRAGCHGVFLGG